MHPHQIQIQESLVCWNQSSERTGKLEIWSRGAPDLGRWQRRSYSEHMKKQLLWVAVRANLSIRPLIQKPYLNENAGVEYTAVIFAGNAWGWGSWDDIWWEPASSSLSLSLSTCSSCVATPFSISHWRTSSAYEATSSFSCEGGESVSNS